MNGGFPASHAPYLPVRYRPRTPCPSPRVTAAWLRLASCQKSLGSFEPAQRQERLADLRDGLAGFQIDDEAHTHAAHAGELVLAGTSMTTA